MRATVSALGILALTLGLAGTAAAQSGPGDPDHVYDDATVVAQVEEPAISLTVNGVDLLELDVSINERIELANRLQNEGAETPDEVQIEFTLSTDDGDLAAVTLEWCSNGEGTYSTEAGGWPGGGTDPDALECTEWSPLAFDTTTGEGTFGPAFQVPADYDVTSLLRAQFGATGTYTSLTEVVGQGVA